MNRMIAGIDEVPSRLFGTPDDWNLGILMCIMLVGLSLVDWFVHTLYDAVFCASSGVKKSSSS